MGDPHNPITSPQQQSPELFNITWAIHPRTFSSFQLLQHFRPSEPWKCSTSSPNVNKVASLPSGEALEQKLFRLYLTTRFQPSKAMGTAADSWVVYMDRVLTLGDDCADEKAFLRRKMNALIDIYYDALDAPKKRKTSAGCGSRTADTGKISSLYGKRRALHYSNYKSDMQKALNECGNTAAVYQHYRKVLYGGVDDLESSEKDWEEIRLEALAIYNVCYDYAIIKKDPKKCGFAWKVVGDALWKIHLQDKEEKPLLFAPSVIRQIMS